MVLLKGRSSVVFYFYFASKVKFVERFAEIFGMSILLIKS